MCLIVLARDAHPDFPLLVAANRDEFHQRPSAPIHFWDDEPQILAGRDLRGGGSWLGITRSGRFAAVTNFREPGARDQAAPSRGLLVVDFLRSNSPPSTFIRGLGDRAAQCNGFNLIVGDRHGLHYLSNRGAGARALEAGVHGLSNHLLDTPWPKVRRIRTRLQELLAGPGEPTADALLELLDDSRTAADDELPETGLPREWEKVLSAPRIVHPTYGTRSSTALVVDAAGSVTVSERCFDAAGTIVGTATVNFRIETGSAAVQ
jgi:uncharacterized protein with NRDE domain